MMRDLTGDFHFDSERSRSEQDFRIFIRPSDWTAVRQFCIQHFSRVHDPILETDPGRELAEGFGDALKTSLKRVYRIFEAAISDSSLARAMMVNSESLSYQDLCELASEDARSGGRGRANAVLGLPLKRISDIYPAMSLEERNALILFERNRLERTVPAVLEGVSVPRYQRL